MYGLKKLNSMPALLSFIVSAVASIDATVRFLPLSGLFHESLASRSFIFWPSPFCCEIKTSPI